MLLQRTKSKRHKIKVTFRVKKVMHKTQWYKEKKAQLKHGIDRNDILPIYSSTRGFIYITQEPIYLFFDDHVHKAVIASLYNAGNKKPIKKQNYFVQTLQNYPRQTKFNKNKTAWDETFLKHWSLGFLLKKLYSLNLLFHKLPISCLWCATKPKWYLLRTAPIY